MSTNFHLCDKKYKFAYLLVSSKQNKSNLTGLMYIRYNNKKRKLL